MEKRLNLPVKDKISSAISKIGKPWKVLIADDDEAVHQITKMVLENEEFEGKGFEILSSYTGNDTIRAIEENSDIAVLFLDVVMEKENSGLEVVQYVREILKNSKIRIILRTGQPGQAPEKIVAKKYDINDYKEKTELTAQKMTTALISALRAYRDLDTIERSKIGLERIITSTNDLLEKETIDLFTVKIVKSINSIIGTKENEEPDAFLVKICNEKYKIMASVGKFAKSSEEELKHLIENTIENTDKIDMENITDEMPYFEKIKTSRGGVFLFYLSRVSGINVIERYLLKILIFILGVDFENIELVETQRNMLAELANEREKAESALQVKTEFLSNMSHELRTPLTGISGVVTLLPYYLNEKDSAIMRILSTSTDRLTSLIDKLFNYVDINKNNVTAVNINFLFKTIIEDVLFLINQKELKKNIQLKTEIDEGLEIESFIGDSVKITHIIYFLMENAIKFTNEGNVSLKISRAEIFGKYQMVDIEVADTGIGIKDEVAEKVFDPFYQGEYYLNKQYGGVGISLSIVKKLVELIKGTINFTTNENTGTVFLVKIPLEI